MRYGSLGDLAKSSKVTLVLWACSSGRSSSTEISVSSLKPTFSTSHFGLRRVTVGLGFSDSGADGLNGDVERFGVGMCRRFGLSGATHSAATACFGLGEDLVIGLGIEGVASIEGIKIHGGKDTDSIAPRSYLGRVTLLLFQMGAYGFYLQLTAGKFP
jgi:hypothetical protein